MTERDVGPNKTTNKIVETKQNGRNYCTALSSDKNILVRHPFPPKMQHSTAHKISNTITATSELTLATECMKHGLNHSLYEENVGRRPVNQK